MEGVNVIDVFLSLVDLALDPVPVEVSEEMVVVCACSCVSVPLFDVECEKSFIGVFDHLGVDAFEMFLEVVIEAFVEVLAKEVCWSSQHGRSGV